MDKEIKAGTNEQFMVPIVTGQNSTFIPVSVFNGVKDGETLGITAGVHGYDMHPFWEHKNWSTRSIREN